LMEIGCRPPKAWPFSEPTTITYHESCHLVHGQKIARQPRALLKLLPGVSFVELPESSWCCGAAGIYAITQPEQAERLLRALPEQAERPVQEDWPEAVQEGWPEQGELPGWVEWAVVPRHVRPPVRRPPTAIAEHARVG